ncbi:MAG TPA: ATP-binding protein [Gammaproteobacteria bacterium]|nr:ATP-binding protein [Gammaproteobacteria bacterium]
MALGGYMLLGGFVSFLGWVLDAPALTDWDADGIAIQPNATLAAVTAGAALVLHAAGRLRPAAVLGAVVLAIGSLTLFEWLSRVNLGIDTPLMFDRTWGRVGVISPGRMGPPGSVSWTMIGAALLLASLADRAKRKVAVLLALVPAAISALSLIGYLYGASALFTIPTLTIIAAQTATFIFAAALALIVSVPEHGPMTLVMKRNTAGVLVRRLLPVLILGPVLLGLVRVFGERYRLYDTAFGSALRTIVEISLFLVLLWRTGVAIDRQTAERDIAEAERQKLLELEKEARADAERQATIKDEFLATLSHELRTPLNAVLGWCQVLRRSMSDENSVRRAVDVIERNGRLQAQLIADLLDMSRIVSGKMRLDVQPVDLPQLIDAAIESVRPAAEAKDLTIERTIEPPRDRVNGDAGRLQQIVWNLLSNAVKFTPRGGRVTVTLRPVDQDVEICVADNGEGFAPEFLPSLFNRFRQADASATRSHGGLGLGLALVKQLVEMHGGRVSATSPGLGHGATFVVRLPAEVPEKEKGQAPAPPALERNAAPSELPDLAGVSVLVVDDEPDALEAVRRILEDSGAHVLVAGGADEALEHIRAQRFDVIVSDIAMPKRDGYELVAELRRNGIITPAVALTAYARADDRRKAMLAGYNAHAAKPTEPAELLARIAELAGRRSPAPTSP